MRKSLEIRVVRGEPIPDITSTCQTGNANTFRVDSFYGTPEVYCLSSKPCPLKEENGSETPYCNR
jgi:hypothetical protein